MADAPLARFTLETGTRVLVQVPEDDVAAIIRAVQHVDPLPWGDYDRVTFSTAKGVQQFRSLPGGRNAPTDEAVAVPCVELQFFTLAKDRELASILTAIFDAHPYEEPVIQLMSAQRTRHIPGVDEDNPNRFWNREPADWVPDAHRSTQSVSAYNPEKA